MHSCEICETFGKECQSLDLSNILSHLKTFDLTKGNFGGLSTPPENFVSFIFNLDNKFNSEFEKIFIEDQISHKLLNLFQNIKFDHPCKDFPKLFLYKLFIRCKVFLKFRNRDLKYNRNKQSKQNSRKLRNLMHV